MALILGLTVVVLFVAGFIAYWLIMISFFVLCAVFLFWYFVFISLFHDNIMLILPSTIIATGLCIWAGIAWDASKKASIKNVD